MRYLIMKNLTSITCIFLISLSAFSAKPEEKKEERSWVKTAVLALLAPVVVYVAAKRLVWCKPTPTIVEQDTDEQKRRRTAEAAEKRFGSQPKGELPAGLRPRSAPVVTQGGGSSETAFLGGRTRTWNIADVATLTPEQQAQFDRTIPIRVELVNPLQQAELEARALAAAEEELGYHMIQLLGQEVVDRQHVEHAQATAAARHVEDPDLVAARLMVALQQMELSEAIQAERQRQQQQIVQYVLQLAAEGYRQNPATATMMNHVRLRLLMQLPRRSEMVLGLPAQF